MARTQRRRPAAGIETVYEDEQYSAIALYDPRFFKSRSALIQVYSKPYHDFIFSAFQVGLFFWCKRCEREHLLRWQEFARMQAQEIKPPYHVLCTQMEDIWLVRADEPIPDHIKAYRIYTLDDDIMALTAALAAFLTSNAA